MSIIMNDLFMTLCEATRVPDPDGPSILDPASFLPYRNADGTLCEAFAWDLQTVRDADQVTRYYDAAGNPVGSGAGPGEVLNPEYIRKVREVVTYADPYNEGGPPRDEYEYEWTVMRMVPGSGGRTQTLGRGRAADPADAVRACLDVRLTPAAEEPRPEPRSLVQEIRADLDASAGRE